MSENGQPSNPDLAKLIADMPAVIKFLYLQPTEEIVSIALVEAIFDGQLSRGAMITKSRTVNGETKNDSISLLREQLLEVNHWFRSITTKLAANYTLGPIITGIGSNLIRVNDVIRPELPPKPIV